MSAIKHVKEIADLVKKYNDQDLYQKIVDLRDEIFDLREENLDLKEKLKGVESAKEIGPQLQRESNHYTRTHRDGSKSGPFCLACWDADNKLIGLQEFAYGVQKCGRCEKGKG